MTTNHRSTTIWKLLFSLYVLCALGLLAFVSLDRHLTEPNEVGSLGATLRQEEVLGSRGFVVDKLLPTSPLLAAGLKPGDVVEFDRYLERRGTRLPGMDVGLTVRGDGRHLQVQTIPRMTLTDDGFAVLTVVYVLVSCVIGMVIGFKLADQVATRALAVYLVGIGFNGIATLPLPGMASVLTQYVWSLTLCPIWASLLVFAFTYNAESAGPRRRALARALPAFMVCAALGTLVYGWGTTHAIPRIDLINFIWTNLLSLLVVFALWDAWRSSTGEMRQRHLWLFILFGTRALIGPLTFIPRLMGTQDLLFFWIQRGGTLFILAGLAYAILRHRVLNVSFAFNRALVYTIISTLVLIAFSITEWAVDKLLHFQGREKNAVFDALVALGIILSFHRIQHGVSHWIDHTFFRYWYAAAEKLNLFLLKAAHISDTEALLTKFLAAVEQFCGAGAAVYVAEQGGQLNLQQATWAQAPPFIDGNDDVVIDLRHAQAPVGLSQEGKFGLPGEVALPMMVRGRVNGILVIGLKPDGSHLRPDQTDLLARAAHQLGLSLETLRVEKLERDADALQRQITLTEQQLAVAEREAQTLRQLAGAAN